MKTLATISLLVALFASLSFSQVNSNWRGYGDTAQIAGFQGTGTVTSKAFNFTLGEQAKLIAMANDSASAGFASDAVKFFWGFQIGDIVINSSGKADTTWQGKTTVDTFDVTTAGNMVVPINVMGADGTYNTGLKFIDTLNVTGYAVQSRNVAADWGNLIRFWATGLSGNQPTTYVLLRFEMNRRAFISTRNM